MDRKDLSKPPITLAVPSPEEIAVFKELYERLFEVELTNEEALETGTAYLQMFQILTLNLKEEDEHFS